MAGELNYFYIPVDDPEHARAFYGAVLGWEFEQRPESDGFRITNTTPPGGLVSGREGSTPHIYFGVDDIHAAVARVRQLGGQAGDPVEFSDGASSECSDDQGISFGLFQPAPGR